MATPCPRGVRQASGPPRFHEERDVTDAHRARQGGGGFVGAWNKSMVWLDRQRHEHAAMLGIFLDHLEAEQFAVELFERSTSATRSAACPSRASFSIAWSPTAPSA
jgi:hypothetical protein